MFLADIHCHLLAGLDDGPRTEEEALAMCRLASEEGVCLVSATAHQNESWPGVTPERIRAAASRLSRLLAAAGIRLTVFPSAEVEVTPDLESSWHGGKLMSLADQGQYLLLEMPHGLFVEMGDTLNRLRQAGVRPVLAHPERHEELLHDPGRIEQMIHAGCLVQISSRSVTDPPSRRDAQALAGWLKRGVVHFVGSDGHSLSRRRPLMAEAYRRTARIAGRAVADRICGTHGMAALQGLPLRIAAPAPRIRRWWLPTFW